MSADLPPDISIGIITMWPYFSDPDPISAVSKDYFLTWKELGKYIKQLKAGLQTLVQGPLDYCLVSFINSWNNLNLRVEWTEFDLAVCLMLAVLNTGPSCTNTAQAKTSLDVEDWDTLAFACLIAIAYGFIRSLKEATWKSYIAFWESIDDNLQQMLKEDENPKFHSLLQWLRPVPNTLTFTSMPMNQMNCVSEPLSLTPSRYAFCQYLSPKMEHKKGPYDYIMRVGSRWWDGDKIKGLDTVGWWEWQACATVGQKTASMFGCFAKIELEQIKKIEW